MSACLGNFALYAKERKKPVLSLSHGQWVMKNINITGILCCFLALNMTGTCTFSVHLSHTQQRLLCAKTSVFTLLFLKPDTHRACDRNGNGRWRRQNLSINVSISRFLTLSLLEEKKRGFGADLKWEPQPWDHGVVSRLHPKAPQCLSMVPRGVGGKCRGEVGLSTKSPETPVSPRDRFYPENSIYT